MKPKHECVEKWSNEQASDPPKHYSEHNNEKDCKENDGEWLEYHNYLEILDYNENECDEKNKNDAMMKGKKASILPSIMNGVH